MTVAEPASQKRNDRPDPGLTGTCRRIGHSGPPRLADAGGPGLAGGPGAPPKHCFAPAARTAALQPLIRRDSEAGHSRLAFIPLILHGSATAKIVAVARVARR